MTSDRQQTDPDWQNKGQIGARDVIFGSKVGQISPKWDRHIQDFFRTDISIFWMRGSSSIMPQRDRLFQINKNVFLYADLLVHKFSNDVEERAINNLYI